MAEYCKDCFTDMVGSIKEEHLRMTKEPDICESCGRFVPVVHGVYISDKHRLAVETQKAFT